MITVTQIVKRINDSESDLYKVFSILNSAVIQTSLSSGPVTENAPMSYRDLQAIYAKASLNVRIIPLALLYLK